MEASEMCPNVGYRSMETSLSGREMKKKNDTKNSERDDEIQGKSSERVRAEVPEVGS